MKGVGEPGAEKPHARIDGGRLEPERWVLATYAPARTRWDSLAHLDFVTALEEDGPQPGDFRTWTRNDWIAAFDAMMLSPIEMMRLTVDGMMERGFGRIVNIVSRSVKIPQIELGLSNGARSGLVGFVAGLSRQTVARNVTINNLLPGIFDSDAQVRHIEGMLEPGGKSFDQIWHERAAANPAKRYGRPAELGGSRGSATR